MVLQNLRTLPSFFSAPAEQAHGEVPAHSLIHSQCSSVFFLTLTCAGTNGHEKFRQRRGRVHAHICGFVCVCMCLCAGVPAYACVHVCVSACAFLVRCADYADCVVISGGKDTMISIWQIDPHCVGNSICVGAPESCRPAQGGGSDENLCVLHFDLLVCLVCMLFGHG